METNPLTDEHRRIREEIDHSDPVALDDPRLAGIVRLRLLSDPGFPYWDVSYCYGRLDTGEHVRVTLPQHQFRKGRPLRLQLVEMCREARVYAKGLGLLDEGVISTLS